MGLLVVGSNHRTASMELRSSLAFRPEQVDEALQIAQDEQVLDETMILSTCNRTEFYSIAPDVAAAEEYVRSLVSRIKGTDLMQPGPHRYSYQDREMVSHLFRVSASLDSMMVGEMQILGQIKDAYSFASEKGSTGAVMNRLLSTAMRVGKRARSETSIGAGSVSVASAAVTLTTKIMSDLSDKRVLLVGAGETGRLTAKHFSEHHPSQMLIANRTPARAQELAREMGGEHVDLASLGSVLVQSDVVVCATRSPEVLIDAPMVREAMKQRRNRPMVIVDISMPRNVAPDVSRIDNVFSYPIDALQNLVEKNLTRRRKEIPRVETIIEEELTSFFRWTRSLQVTPVVKALRSQFEEVRLNELEKSLGQIPEAERKKVEALTRSIVNKLLHHPTVAIRKINLDSDEGVVKLDAACQLFDLHPDLLDDGAKDKK